LGEAPIAPTVTLYSATTQKTTNSVLLQSFMKL